MLTIPLDISDAQTIIKWLLLIFTRRQRLIGVFEEPIIIEHLHEVFHVDDVYIGTRSLAVETVTVTVIPRATRRTLAGRIIRQWIRLFHVRWVHDRRRLLMSVHRSRGRRYHSGLLISNRCLRGALKARVVNYRHFVVNRRLLKSTEILITFTMMVIIFLWGVERGTIVPVHFRTAIPILHHFGEKNMFSLIYTNLQKSTCYDIPTDETLRST